MNFDYTYDRKNAEPSPEYENIRYGDRIPVLKHPKNIQYLEFIDLIDFLWTKGNPEILFKPFGGDSNFEPEKGYIVYGLERRVTKQNEPRPHLRETITSADGTEKKLVFSQTFVNLISFTALHRNPRVAEEIMEAFEDFMIMYTPIFNKCGIENINYARRTPDEHDTRYGKDVAARVVMYQVMLQKLLTVDVDVLDSVTVEASAYIQLRISDTNQATPNIQTYIYDNHATPSF